VVNIGVNPTFEGNKLCIEAYIFDFNKNLFGKEITIFFVKRIRDEKKFKDAKSLAGQIEKDIEFAKKVLEKNKIYD